VQLPNFMEPWKSPVEDSGWPQSASRSRRPPKEVRNTGMAITIDIGRGTRYSSEEQQDVGDRLARVALHKTYA